MSKKIIISIIIILIIIAGIIIYFVLQKPTEKCGDGVCDDFEQQTGRCPEDCEEEKKEPTEEAPKTLEQPEDKCGDGICDDFEQQRKELCPEDCQ